MSKNNIEVWYDFKNCSHYIYTFYTDKSNGQSKRYYRLKFADTYYGEMTHYGLYRLAWADVRRAR